MNILLIFSELVISFASIIYLYKKYNNQGIYIWIIIAILIGNIMITKSISISDSDINLGIILITTIIICTNLLIQKEGEEESNKVLKIVSIVSILSTIMYLIISFTTISNINIVTDKSFNNLIQNNLAIYISNTISLLITLKVNSYIYYKVKKIENKLWISNIISMIVSQILYQILFGTMYLAYINTFLNLTITLIIRFLIAISTQLMGTILIYYLNKKERNKI